MEKWQEAKEVRNDHLIMMSRMLSHNLRSPVAGMKMLFPLYERMPNDKAKAEIFGNIQEGAEQLFDMIEDLSKLLLDYVELSEEAAPVSFQISLDAAVNSLTSEIPEEAKIEADFSNVSTVSYSQKFVDFLFLELISNSIRFRDKSRPLDLKVKSYQENYRTILSFSDNGRGIDLDKHGDKLFKLYKTFHNDPEINSRGVGLFTIKNQIEMMGGRLSMDSEIDKGTIVKVELFA